MPAQQKKGIESLAPEIRTGTVRRPQPVEHQAQTTHHFASPTGPNNRVVLRDETKGVFEHTVDAETEIAASTEGEIQFTNGWSLAYWLPDFHQVSLTPQQAVYIQHRADFISGAFFKSVMISSKDRMPILHLISMGGHRPIEQEIANNVIIRQQEKELDFVDNESETVKEVVTSLNDRTAVAIGKATALRIQGNTYQVSLQQSYHYYPKGTDSVAGPPYYLAFTVTKAK